MYAQVEKKKTKENKSRVVANAVAPRVSNVNQGFGFVYNCPNSIIPRKKVVDGIVSIQKRPGTKKSECAEMEA